MATVVQNPHSIDKNGVWSETARLLFHVLRLYFPTVGLLFPRFAVLLQREIKSFHATIYLQYIKV